MNRYFWGLTTLQADGLACVVCEKNFLHDGVTSVRVGSTQDEIPVYACLEPCTVTIAEEAAAMAREIGELAKSAGGELPVLELPDDPIGSRDLGLDGHFGSLLRDLRVLTGTESLLATIDDLPTLKFLLSMAAMHAETAMDRARVIIARIEAQSSGDG
ncbi:hypothetical protein [Streptomyces uncialis]|uniref:hypothetical protein n=1 Tax=Streptomyces uncialis TaxID=1048205 RepID=UPI00225B83C4|nr:hypothetical protein [Streptomyces uncialis]MCX4663483.1 hypothetical protein [Streptomyces uncialis]